jgi:hypothetical protein
MREGGAMLNGRCLCASVSYDINGPLDEVRNCHCSMCRKAHGTAFRFRASVRCRDLRRTAGEKLITWYESSPGTERGFCSRCGSPLLSRFSKSPELCGLPLGRLDTDPGMRQAMHIFVGSKAYWFEIADSLPRYEAGPSR